MLTIDLPEDLEKLLLAEVEAAGYASDDQAVDLALPGSSSLRPPRDLSPRSNCCNTCMKVGMITRYQPERRLRRHDEPIEIEGEPLSETIIRDAADGGFFFDTSALIKRHVREPGSTGSAPCSAPGRPTRFISRHHGRRGLRRHHSTATRRERSPRPRPGPSWGTSARHLTQRYIVRDLTPALCPMRGGAWRGDMGWRSRCGERAGRTRKSTASIETSGIGPLTLVSADRELNAAATAEGLVVDDPNSHP